MFLANSFPIPIQWLRRRVAKVRSEEDSPICPIYINPVFFRCFALDCRHELFFVLSFLCRRDGLYITTFAAKTGDF